MVAVHMKSSSGYHRPLCVPWEAMLHAPWANCRQSRKDNKLIHLTTHDSDLVTCPKCKRELDAA